jgi:hypothetical protein
MAITLQDIRAGHSRGVVTYDDQYGHVCTCTEVVEYDDEGYPSHATFLPTVEADRCGATESGSYFYTCQRCGAGAWSGL